MSKRRSAIVIQAEARVDEPIRKRAEADAKQGKVIVIGAPKPPVVAEIPCLWCLKWDPSEFEREMHICRRVTTQRLACADAA